MNRMYWIHALSPVHAGSGSGVGFIDLPIAREKTTNWPYVPGSAVKGVMADRFGASRESERGTDTAERRLRRAAFGVANPKDSNAGALVYSDARMVCLPVRSFAGTFAWVTSRMALRRLTRDIEACAMKAPADPPAPADGLVAEGACVANGGVAYVADLNLKVKADAAAGAWAKWLSEALFPNGSVWRSEFVKRFLIADDATFDYLCETATEVSAHIRIDPDKRSVARGALWYEECLPAETILGGVVWCDRIYLPGADAKELSTAKLMDTFCTKRLQLQVGGKATVGKGRVDCVFGAGGQ